MTENGQKRGDLRVYLVCEAGNHDATFHLLLSFYRLRQSRAQCRARELCCKILSSEAGSYDATLPCSLCRRRLRLTLTHTLLGEVCASLGSACAPRPWQGTPARETLDLEARGSGQRRSRESSSHNVPCSSLVDIQYSGPAGARGAVAEKHVHAQWSLMNLVRRVLASRGTCY